MIGVDEFLSKLKESLVSLGTTAVMSYLNAQAPVLMRIPLLTKIIEYFTKRFLTFITNSLELGAYYAYIENHCREQAVAFADASVAYERAKGTPDEKLANEARLEAARKLISLRK